MDINCSSQPYFFILVLEICSVLSNIFLLTIWFLFLLQTAILLLRIDDIVSGVKKQGGSDGSSQKETAQPSEGPTEA